MFIDINQQLLDVYFLPHDIQRLEAYSRNQIEYRLILDLTSDICLLYFQGKMNDVPIDALQKVISFRKKLRFISIQIHFHLTGNSNWCWITK